MVINPSEDKWEAFFSDDSNSSKRESSDGQWEAFFSEVYSPSKEEISTPSTVQEVSEIAKIPKEYQPEARPAELTRGAARTATRSAELPVNILKGLSQIPENVLKGPLGQKIVEALKPVSGLAQYLPEQEEMEAFERKYTGEYLQPQSPGEEKWDEYVKDVGSLLIDPSKKFSLPIKLGRAALIGFAGQEAKDLAKSMGAGEEGQGYAKMGTNLALSMINPGAVRNMSRQLRGKAMSSIPETATGNASSLKSSLEEMIKDIDKKQSTTAGERIKKEAQGILSKIQDDKLPYQQAVDIKTALNENSSELYKDPMVMPVTKKALRAHFDRVRGHLKDYIAQSEKEFPEFFENISKSDEVYSAIAQSEKMSNFLSKHRGIIEKGGIASPIVALFTGGPMAAAGAAATAAGAIGAYQGRKILKQIAKSPTLREHYFNALTAASKENIGVAVQEIRRFQREAEKDKEFMKEIEGIDQQS